MYLLEDVFEQNDIGFKSVTESFDTTTPFGKAAIGMLAVFAQLERETIIERSRMGKKEAAKQGRFVGGGAPYGYEYNVSKRSLEVNPNHAEVVRLIYDTYLNKKYGFQVIADTLNKNKIPGPISDTWKRDIVRKILRNPYYAGYIPHKGDKYPGQHEAIISPEKWEQAQIQLQERYVPIPAKDSDNLLTGLIWCAECGSRMRFKAQTWHNRRTLKYYICYAQMKNKTAAKADSCDCGFKRVEKINEYILSHIIDFASNKDKFFKYVNEYFKQFDTEPQNNEIVILKKEQQSLQSKIDRWYSAFEEGQFDAHEVLKRISSLREKRDDIISRLDELEQNSLRKNRLITDAEEIFKRIQELSKMIKTNNVNDARTLIALIISKIVISKDDTIDIQWRLDIPTCR